MAELRAGEPRPMDWSEFVYVVIVPAVTLYIQFSIICSPSSRKGFKRLWKALQALLGRAPAEAEQASPTGGAPTPPVSSSPRASSPARAASPVSSSPRASSPARAASPAAGQPGSPAAPVRPASPAAPVASPSSSRGRGAATPPLMVSSPSSPSAARLPSPEGRAGSPARAASPRPATASPRSRSEAGPLNQPPPVAQAESPPRTTEFTGFPIVGGWEPYGPEVPHQFRGRRFDVFERCGALWFRGTGDDYEVHATRDIPDGFAAEWMVRLGGNDRIMWLSGSEDYNRLNMQYWEEIPAGVGGAKPRVVRFRGSCRRYDGTTEAPWTPRSLPYTPAGSLMNSASSLVRVPQPATPKAPPPIP
eukprot:TRINITY_DN6883_c0_g1_i1.p1 TRINITY_DN6883_c0_g1~~TRINITY_DN6883_c0_g1_i1.p1  ORF type:complete len:388 (+),score=64.85 TRINITY_DN6883_c0_g1_i1:79-1164(+)